MLFKNFCNAEPVVFVAALLLATSANAAPVLQITNRILTGATGVLVNGSSYDVEFRDGTCMSLFSGCDSSEFTFTTLADANAAASALVSTVFLNFPTLPNFDSDTRITRGCEMGAAACEAITPYAYGQFLPNSIAASFAVNYSGNDVDTLFDGALYRDSDTVGSFTSSSTVDMMFAIWSQSNNSVPEPSTIWLALGAFGLLSRDAKAPDLGSARTFPWCPLEKSLGLFFV